MSTSGASETGREFEPDLDEEDEAALDALESTFEDDPDENDILEDDEEFGDDELVDDDE